MTTTPTNPPLRNKCIIKRVRPKIGDEVEVDVPEGCDGPPLVITGARSELYLLWFKTAPEEQLTNGEGSPKWTPPKRRGKAALRAVT